MCIMCLEFANDRMKLFEVRKALTELVDTTKNAQELKHFQDLANMTDEQLAEHARKIAAMEDDLG